jgi:hypothetical protein
MIRPIGLIILAFLVDPITPVSAQDSGAKCKIGRPAYCFKHGGTLCEKTNTTNAVGACNAWTSACLDCHEAIGACLGNRIQLRSASICSKCDASWSACMRKIDSRYWPNRQKLG